MQQQQKNDVDQQLKTYRVVANADDETVGGAPATPHSRRMAERADTHGPAGPTSEVPLLPYFVFNCRAFSLTLD